jgi:hypothetical protein
MKSAWLKSLRNGSNCCHSEERSDEESVLWLEINKEQIPRFARDDSGEAVIRTTSNLRAALADTETRGGVNEFHGPNRSTNFRRGFQPSPMIVVAPKEDF